MGGAMRLCEWLDWRGVACAWLAVLQWVCAGGVQARTLLAGPDNVNGQVARLVAGDVLLLQPGVYRTELVLRALSGGSDAPITIRGDVANGRVIFRGSDVLSDWTALGGGMYSHSLNQEPSQVFVDGSALQQMGGTVFDGYPLNGASSYRKLHAKEGGIWPGRKAASSKADLIAESFFYVLSERKLYVKSTRDLRSAVVEASVRPRGLFATDVKHLVIEDLEVQHANTSVTGRGGALVVWGESVRLNRVSATWNDLIGIQVGGRHIEVIDSEASFNGQMGLSARGQFNRFVRVRAAENNRRGFNKWWEAGGFKFIGERDAGLLDSQVLECQALNNRGDGIWLDWKNARVEVSRSLSAYNSGFGIHYEVSSQGVIQDNIVLGNGQRGIYLSTSDRTSVLNNLVVGNGLEGVVSIWDKARVDEDGRAFSGAGNVVDANVLAYNAEGSVTLPSDSGAVSDRNVFWGDGAASRFSLDFPSPWNPPNYGLSAWTDRSAQDARSWWQNRPLSPEWQSYLSRKSTELAPLLTLLAASRAEPPTSGLILGRQWSGTGGGRPTASVGPRHL